MYGLGFRVRAFIRVAVTVTFTLTKWLHNGKHRGTVKVTMRVIKGVAVWLLLGVAICITDFGGVELCIPWASGFIFIAT